MSAYREQNGGSESGVALIAAVLAVAVLLAIGLSFAFNMRLEEKAAINYMNSLKAKYVAEAGVQYAVAELRNDANPSGGYSYATTEHDQFGDTWNSVSGSIDFGAGVIGTYTVTVVDTARRIYLNDFELTNAELGGLLQDLVDRLIDDTTVTAFTKPPDEDDTSDGTNIGFYRPDKDAGGYITKRQITVVDGSTINATEYGILNNYVTSEGYFDDPNRFLRSSAVNINTADQRVLQAVFESMDVGDSDRDTIVQAILEYRTGKEYDINPDGIGGNNDRWQLKDPEVLIGAGNPNPFDGIDSNRNDNIDPIIEEFTNDSLNNDGDDTTDEEDEAYLFAGGARGEFNALIDYITSNVYGSGSGTIISSETADIVKNNADPAQRPATVGLDFESKFFAITSTGTITQGNEQLAESEIIRIVERER